MLRPKTRKLQWPTEFFFFILSFLSCHYALWNSTCIVIICASSCNAGMRNRVCSLSLSVTLLMIGNFFSDKYIDKTRGKMKSTIITWRKPHFHLNATYFCIVLHECLSTKLKLNRTKATRRKTFLYVLIFVGDMNFSTKYYCEKNIYLETTPYAPRVLLRLIMTSWMLCGDILIFFYFVIIFGWKIRVSFEIVKSLFG